MGLGTLGTIAGGALGAVVGGPYGAMAGASIGGAVGGSLDGGKESYEDSEARYISTPIKVKLPSGAVVTLYQNKEIGNTVTESNNDDETANAIQNVITSAGEAYAFGEMYDKGKKTTSTPKTWI